MLKTLEHLCRESASLYFRMGAEALDYAAEGLKSMEAMVAGRDDDGVDLNRPLDPESREGKELMRGLQGNIVQGHGRDHASHLLISFGNPATQSSHALSVSAIRAWIRWMEETHVTSAAGQWADRGKLEPVSCLLLSSQGYEYLGERRPRDGAFREGMRDRGARLNDPAAEDWEEKYTSFGASDIHCLVIVAANDATTVESKKAAIVGQLVTAGGSVLVEERGSQKKDPAGRPIEHFGYADGVSQPQFIDLGKSSAAKYDQLAPLKLVLERDRQASGYGSFLVFRKLEQNVESFEAAVDKVAARTGTTPELAGAMAVGRFRNGTPLMASESPMPTYDPSKDEDFDYANDPEGSRCPLHAHIRKVNPRGSIGFIRNILAREQTRRIARRGITYESGSGKGLLFMCFQSDIRDQFEFLQSFWANNPDFSEAETGLDPLVGQAGGAHRVADSPRWPTSYGSDERERVRFDEHVRLRGGEYFFAPSLAGLRALGISRR